MLPKHEFGQVKEDAEDTYILSRLQSGSATRCTTCCKKLASSRPQFSIQLRPRHDSLLTGSNPLATSSIITWNLEAQIPTSQAIAATFSHTKSTFSADKITVVEKHVTEKQYFKASLQAAVAVACLKGSSVKIKHFKTEEFLQIPIDMFLVLLNSFSW